MQQLNDDVLQIIISFLYPKEIITFYDSSDTTKIIIDRLVQYYNLTIHCTVIVTNEELVWFQKRNITLQLLKIYSYSYFLEEWFQNGQLHRDDDLPAFISHNGSCRKWYQNGFKHRDNDSPAVIDHYGTQEWYQHGVLHRDNDLPAAISSNGTISWFQNGQLHRDNDLPAVIFENDDRLWYQNGLLHRDNDLPALIYDGFSMWYQHGLFIKK